MTSINPLCVTLPPPAAQQLRSCRQSRIIVNVSSVSFGSGVLKKELQQQLRSRRTIRRSIHTSGKGHGKGQIPDLVSIRERPASVEDRAIPGPLGR